MSVCRYKGKRQDADPEGAGDHHSRTLKKNECPSASEGLRTKKITMAVTWGTEVYVRLSACRNESQDVGKEASSQGDKSKLILLDDSSLNSPSLKSELLLEPGGRAEAADLAVKRIQHWEERGTKSGYQVRPDGTKDASSAALLIA